MRDFRNYGRLDADFSPGFHLFLGENAQGKTNILEAIYLMATLRSFRGVGSAQMIRHGARGYFVGGNVVDPQKVVFTINRNQLNGVMQARIPDDNSMTVTVAVRVNKQLVPVIGMSLKRVDTVEVGAIAKN